MLNINDLKEHIVKKEFIKMWEKTVICLLTLDNGFEVVWSTAPINKENFSLEVGEQYAYEKAVDKLWELYWFLEHCKRNPEDIPTPEYWG